MSTLGRPKITTDDFSSDWKERVVQEMSEGASRIEVYAGILGIDYETFTRLLNEDEDFSKTIKRGIDLAQVWWEKQGRKGLKDKDFNYTGWYMNMKNRFGWRDRTETDITSKGEQIGSVDPSTAVAFADYLKGKQ